MVRFTRGNIRVLAGIHPGMRFRFGPGTAIGPTFWQGVGKAIGTVKKFEGKRRLRFFGVSPKRKHRRKDGEAHGRKLTGAQHHQLPLASTRISMRRLTSA